MKNAPAYYNAGNIIVKFKSRRIGSRMAKNTKWQWNTPKYSILKTNKYQKFSFLVWKYTIWQPWFQLKQKIHQFLDAGAGEDSESGCYIHVCMYVQIKTDGNWKPEYSLLPLS
jgi:hypothetical protein